MVTPSALKLQLTGTDCSVRKSSISRQVLRRQCVHNKQEDESAGTKSHSLGHTEDPFSAVRFLWHNALETLLQHKDVFPTSQKVF